MCPGGVRRGTQRGHSHCLHAQERRHARSCSPIRQQPSSRPGTGSEPCGTMAEGVAGGRLGGLRRWTPAVPRTSEVRGSATHDVAARGIPGQALAEELAVDAVCASPVRGVGWDKEAAWIALCIQQSSVSAAQPEVGQRAQSERGRQRGESGGPPTSSRPREACQSVTP